MVTVKMNIYLRNLEKIEFVVTSLCTGRCKHCSEGDHSNPGEMIDPDIAADAVRKIADKHSIKTVMTFGGEPLLHPLAVEKIIGAARDMKVPRRQVITNGYFANDIEEIAKVTERLATCGVNDLLLSVDAFHQETIPLEIVRAFAKEAIAHGIPIRLQPAWLVSRFDQNPYNLRTREILDSLTGLKIPESEGNVVFPEGNALKYLAKYFLDALPENPYVEDPRDVKCISFSANGDVLGGNVYKSDIIEIMNSYSPDRE